MIRALWTVACGTGVIAAACWAYQENDRTRTSTSRLNELREMIGAEHERLEVLNVEWAYLNRPDRLRDLVDLNFFDLWLVPVAHTRFGMISQVELMPKDAEVRADLDSDAPGDRTELAELPR